MFFSDINKEKGGRRKLQMKDEEPDLAKKRIKAKKENQGGRERERALIAAPCVAQLSSPAFVRKKGRERDRDRSSSSPSSSSWIYCTGAPSFIYLRSDHFIRLLSFGCV